MIRRVVRDKGSLHNRITHRITQRPFTLPQVGLFLDARGIAADPRQRLELYMAIGGVPFYLDLLAPGLSAQQNLQRLLFDEDAPLRTEFDLLYGSLFTQSERHVAVVRALAKRHVGRTRAEVEALTGLPSGGGLTKVLEELELSGFVDRSYPFARKRKHTLYRLIDEYSAFYLKFVEGSRPGANVFYGIAASPGYRSWSGFAFERVCLRNVDAVLRALGISGIAVSAASYVARATDRAGGVQVDLLLDRADNAVSIVEAKYADDDYAITKAYAAELREKVRRFRKHTRTRKQVFVALVTTYGLRQNPHSVGLIDRLVTLKQLMRGAG